MRPSPRGHGGVLRRVRLCTRGLGQHHPGRQERSTPYVACVVLATTRLDVNRAVRKRLGVKKASFADPDQHATSPGC